MPSAGFRLFGFPVQVRPGFVIFLLIVMFLYGGSLGVWAAGAIAVFTLVHELGHAFAARATGARAEISLDFLAGYASYVPSRPLSHAERIGISAAGALAQMSLAIVVLLALGVNPLSFDAIGRSDATVAIWWAGVALALLNLLPVLPLDGGTIVATVLDVVFPGRGSAYMVWISLALTGLGVVAVVTNDALRPFTFLVALLGVLQLQQLSETRQRVNAAGRSGDDITLATRLSFAEQQAWLTGTPGPLPGGAVPSPWFVAHRALQRGDHETARRTLLDDLANDRPAVWWPPDAADVADLRALVAVLPEPLPDGNRYSVHVLIGVLMRLGQHERAARYGSSAFTRSPSGTTALLVARSVAALGDERLAIQWLQAAGEASSDQDQVLLVIDRAPELEAVRHRPEVEALRQFLLGT